MYDNFCTEFKSFPPRSIPASKSGVTRKNRHVPCFDRNQSPAVMAASRAMIRADTVFRGVEGASGITISR